MSKVLKVSREKLRDKRITSSEQSVTSIRREPGQSVDLDALKSSLREGFESHLEIKLSGSELTDFGLALAQALAEKYASESYMLMR